MTLFTFWQRLRSRLRKEKGEKKQARGDQYKWLDLTLIGDAYLKYILQA